MSVVATVEDIQEELILLIEAGIAGAKSRRTSKRVRPNMGRAVEKGLEDRVKSPQGGSYIQSV